MGKKFTPALAYDFLTPFFDGVCSLLSYGKAFKRMALALSGIRDSERVLDVGCGSGTLIIEAGMGYPNLDIVGIDPDQKILRFAEMKLARAGVKATLVQGFAQELPFPSASFDLVLVP